MNGKSKEKLIIAGVTAAILIVIFAIITNLNVGPYVFYYPSVKDGAFLEEHRKLSVLFDQTQFTIELTKEYILGPLNYDLKLYISEGVYAKNVFCITLEGKEAVVIDFSKEFLVYIRVKNDDAALFLDGLQRTLKKNTSMKQIYITVEGQPVEARVGKWDLAYPIPVTGK